MVERRKARVPDRKGTQTRFASVSGRSQRLMRPRKPLRLPTSSLIRVNDRILMGAGFPGTAAIQERAQTDATMAATAPRLVMAESQPRLLVRCSGDETSAT